MPNQPKPDSKKYTDLINEIQKGQIKIPKFQRNFVWSLEATASLLDSILKGYPIGTFILWETNERLNDIKNIGNLSLPEVPGDTKVQYVLDGQQRITSLYAAYLGAKIQKEGEKKVTDYSQIFVNLEGDIENNDEPIVTSEKPDAVYISLHEILNFNDNLLQIQESYSHEHFKKVHSYSQAFSTYDFSTIVLRKEDIDSAIEVFTRINTGGQTLTLFEIMSAKTYDESNGFDMEVEFRQLLDELEPIKYNSISSSIILFTISLIISKNKECKRKVILQLDKDQIIGIWNDVISAIKESIDYFRTVYRIPVSAILPYDALLVPFAYFFYFQKDKPTGDQAKYLEEFFWRVALSYRYSSSVESKLAQDIKKIDQILNRERPSYDEYKVFLQSPKDLIDVNFSAGSSYCKGIMCLLAYYEPKDFLTNGKVILDNSWLKVANSKNYHHFFPKAYLKREGIGNENSVVNITLVSADLNKRKIRAKAPSIYLQAFHDENENLQEALRSHLIENIEQFGITSDDYFVFLHKRAEVIYEKLLERIELKHETNRTQDKLYEMILAGESDVLEFKSTLRYDVREGQVNQKLEFVIAKTIAAFLNSEGGTLVMGIDDDGNILGLERDYESLGSGNADKFELHLRQLIKKYLKNSFEKYIKVTFPELDGKEICVVKVAKSSKPVFTYHQGEEGFFVRNGNASIPKNRQEQSEYEKLHWDN